MTNPKPFKDWFSCIAVQNRKIFRIDSILFLSLSLWRKRIKLTSLKIHKTKKCQSSYSIHCIIHVEVCEAEQLTPRIPDLVDRGSTSLARRVVSLRQGTLQHFVSLHPGT